MKMFLRKSFLFSLALTLIIGLTSATSNAQARSEQRHLIAHHDFEGKAISRLFVREYRNKVYLYAHHPAEKTLSVVDVTDARQPQIIKTALLPELSINSEEKTLIFVIGESTTVKNGSANVAGTNGLVMDLSNPVEPEIINRFTNVSHFVTDSRNYIYVAHQGGLTILKPRLPIHNPIFDPYPNGQDLYGG